MTRRSLATCTSVTTPTWTSSSTCRSATTAACRHPVGLLAGAADPASSRRPAANLLSTQDPRGSRSSSELLHRHCQAVPESAAPTSRTLLAAARQVPAGASSRLPNPVRRGARRPHQPVPTAGTRPAAALDPRPSELPPAAGRTATASAGPAFGPRAARPTRPAATGSTTPASAQPAHPGMVAGPVITSSHQGAAARLRAHHAARRQLRRRPLRAAGPAGPRHVVQRDSALPRTPAASSPGALVSYRGVPDRRGPAARSSPSTASTSYLSIDKGRDAIPADTLARGRQPLGCRGAVRRPASRRSSSGPYLHNGSEIATDDTAIAAARRSSCSATSSNTVDSVHRESLNTVVDQLGLAFAGTGHDLHQIIDTCTSFIHTANDNFDITTALISDGNTVLRRPDRLRRASAVFARDLTLFSGTLAGHDRDLRASIDNGSATATELRDVPRAEPGRPRLADQQPGHHRRRRHPNLPGVRQVLVALPLRRRGRGSPWSPSRPRRAYDAHFGLVLTTTPVCATAATRAPTPGSPLDGSNRPMNETRPLHRAGDPESTPAVPQNAAGPHRRVLPLHRWSLYDPATATDLGRRRAARLADPAALPPTRLGEESWKWLLLQPLTRPVIR